MFNFRLLRRRARTGGAVAAADARSALWALTRRAGVLSAWRRRHRHSVGMLTAHGVMDDGPDAAWQPLWPRLHVDRFEAVLRSLQRYYDFVPLSEAVGMLRGDRPIRKHSMVLTFDDGYRNNFTHALPILERLGIPAVFFVCTGFVGTRRCFWIDRLDYALQRLPKRARSFQIGRELVRIDFTNRESLADSYLNLRLALKRQYQTDFDSQVDMLAEQLEREAGAALAEVIDDDPWSSSMTWEQARQALDRGFEVGSHTVDHTRLTFVDSGTARRQLDESRKALEAHLHLSEVTFAYPNGDYSGEVAREVRSMGYSCALTARPGLNRVGDDLYTLRRLNFPNREHPDHVLGLASGFQTAVAQLRPAHPA